MRRCLCRMIIQVGKSLRLQVGAPRTRSVGRLTGLHFHHNRDAKIDALAKLPFPLHDVWD